MSSEEASADYNEFVDIYQAIKTNPFKKWCEEYTIWSMLGDVTDLTVLDIACGDGYYARPIASKGAGRVVGIDISSGQIASAIEKNTEEINIEYHVADAKDIASLNLGKFDVILTVYMIPYVSNPDDLKGLFSSIFQSLNSGGRFISVSSILCGSGTQDHDKLNADLSEPVSSTITLYSADRKTKLSLPQNLWSMKTIESTLVSVGFSSVTWMDAKIDPAGEHLFTSNEMKQQLQECCVGFFVATKK